MISEKPSAGRANPLQPAFNEMHSEMQAKSRERKERKTGIIQFLELKQMKKRNRNKKINHSSLKIPNDN